MFADYIVEQKAENNWIFFYNYIFILKKASKTWVCTNYGEFFTQPY